MSMNQWNPSFKQILPVEDCLCSPGQHFSPTRICSFALLAFQPACLRKEMMDVPPTWPVSSPSLFALPPQPLFSCCPCSRIFIWLDLDHLSCDSQAFLWCSLCSIWTCCCLCPLFSVPWILFANVLWPHHWPHLHSCFLASSLLEPYAVIQCDKSCLITADSPRSPGEKEESHIPRKEMSGLDPMSTSGGSKGKDGTSSKGPSR